MANPRVEALNADASFSAFQRARREFRFRLKEAQALISEIAEAVPELGSYTLGTAFADIQAGLAAARVAIPMAPSIGIVVGWNYIDGLLSIINGINLILDEEDYRQTQNKVKGVLGILSGVQAFALSYNPLLTNLSSVQPIVSVVGMGAATFAGPAFAFMTLCDLVVASIDFYNANKEVTFEGWLDEKVKAINFKDERIAKLEKELEEITAKKVIAFHNLTDKNWRKKQEKFIRKIKAIENKIEKTNNERTELMSDISARSKVYRFTLESNLHSRTDREKFVASKLAAINNEETRKSITTQYNKKLEDADIKKDNQIQTKMNENYKDKRINLIMKGTSFVGMSLLAIAPFTGPAAPFLLAAGLVITSFVAAYYIYKHRQKIADFGAKLKGKISSLGKNSFFKPKAELAFEGVNKKAVEKMNKSPDEIVNKKAGADKQVKLNNEPQSFNKFKGMKRPR